MDWEQAELIVSATVLGEEGAGSSFRYFASPNFFLSYSFSFKRLPISSCCASPLISPGCEAVWRWGELSFSLLLAPEALNFAGQHQTAWPALNSYRRSESSSPAPKERKGYVQSSEFYRSDFFLHFSFLALQVLCWVRSGWRWQPTWRCEALVCCRKGRAITKLCLSRPMHFFASFLPFLSCPTGAERQSCRPGPAPRSHLPSACAAVRTAHPPRAGDVQKASGCDSRSYNHPSGTDLWLMMRLECVTRSTQLSKAPRLRWPPYRAAWLLHGVNSPAAAFGMEHFWAVHRNISHVRAMRIVG